MGTPLASHARSPPRRCNQLPCLSRWLFVSPWLLMMCRFLVSYEFFLGFLFGGWYFFSRWFFFVLDSCDVSACVDWLGNERKKETIKVGAKARQLVAPSRGTACVGGEGGNSARRRLRCFVFASGTLAAVDLQRKG